MASCANLNTVSSIASITSPQITMLTGFIFSRLVEMKPQSHIEKMIATAIILITTNDFGTLILGHLNQGIYLHLQCLTYTLDSATPIIPNMSTHATMAMITDTNAPLPHCAAVRGFLSIHTSHRIKPKIGMRNQRAAHPNEPVSITFWGGSATVYDNHIWDKRLPHR